MKTLTAGSTCTLDGWLAEQAGAAKVLAYPEASRRSALLALELADVADGVLLATGVSRLFWEAAQPSPLMGVCADAPERSQAPSSAEVVASVMAGLVSRGRAGLG